MPVLKPIAGHTGCARIRKYLDKGGRALAHDFFNLSWDERDMEGYDEVAKADVRWDEEMDDVRARFGNDKPFGGRAARTFKHFVLSPDPKDNIDLPALRELASAWALKHFGEYQIAITYHDDNENGIVHAHIVVNNTNLVTGRRLHTESPLALNRDLQDMARERGLSGLSNVRATDEGLARLAEKDAPERTRPRTLQHIYLGRQEKELAAHGAYSWVADIRNRVSVAKALARNESEFRKVLDLLEVHIADNSPKAARADWIYSLADEPTKKVSGGRLGLLFAKETLRADFERKSTYHPSAKSSRELLRCAQGAVLINDLADLEDISRALRTCALYGASSLDECDRRIKALEARVGITPDKQAAKLNERIDELTWARNFMATRELMPQHAIHKTPHSSKHKAAQTSTREAAKRQALLRQTRTRQIQERNRDAERDEH